MQQPFSSLREIDLPGRRQRVRRDVPPRPGLEAAVRGVKVARRGAGGEGEAHLVGPVVLRVVVRGQDGDAVHERETRPRGGVGGVAEDVDHGGVFLQAVDGLAVGVGPGVAGAVVDAGRGVAGAEGEGAVRGGDGVGPDAVAADVGYVEGRAGRGEVGGVGAVADAAKVHGGAVVALFLGFGWV